MSWKLDSLDFDGEISHVVAKISHSETGAQHRLQIAAGFDHCPHCGHVVPKNNLGQIDIRAIIARELESLERAHAQDIAWIRKHNIPARKKAK